ncbi:hypothetical protein [Candidatus Odyssella acanthamoebae]|uniref:hypothetical protein n=1 Tax=Candidatus Odyssella acanthamoebae TaxID=91604 RepID=UPI0012EBE544|nr:hypothetical protein [Candidatus Paracaedibacter acanthamoebae]
MKENEVELTLKLKLLFMGLVTVSLVALSLACCGMEAIDLHDHSKFCRLVKVFLLIGGGYLVAKKFGSINKIAPFLSIPSLFNHADLTLKIKDIYQAFWRLLCRVYAIAFLPILFIDSVRISLFSEGDNFSGFEALGYVNFIIVASSVFMFLIVYKVINEAALYKFDHLELRLGASKSKKRAVIFLLTSLFFILEKAHLILKYFFLTYDLIDIQFISGYPGLRLSLNHSIETLISSLACISITMVVWYILARIRAVSVYRYSPSRRRESNR